MFSKILEAGIGDAGYCRATDSRHAPDAEWGNEEEHARNASRHPQAVGETNSSGGFKLGAFRRGPAPARQRRCPIAFYAARRNGFVEAEPEADLRRDDHVQATAAHLVRTDRLRS